MRIFLNVAKVPGFSPVFSTSNVDKINCHEMNALGPQSMSAPFQRVRTFR